MSIRLQVFCFMLLMSSLIRVTSFSTRFGCNFLRKNALGVQQLRCQSYGSDNKAPWDRSERIREQSRPSSNRFKRKVDQESSYDKEHRNNRDTDLSESNYAREVSSLRPRTTDHSYGAGGGRRDGRRSESYTSDRSSSVDYGNRRSERFNNNRPSTSRGDYGGSQNSYSERRYQPMYDREEKTEPIYGYYEGDHLYGITSVRLALSSGRRQIKELLVQSGMDMANKKDAKAALQILDLARKNGVEVREFSKHDLNMLSDNRPHQGFVLRAQPLEFISLSALEPSENYSCVLALDEVWDPQNFGALLRTAFFLKCDKVVVCSKNSAPLSAAVSRASAGAMEVMKVYSTDNMMKFLDKSKDNGWQVVGTDLSPKSVSLYEVPRTVPTVLVLGNEGHGIRTNVLRRCTHLVRLGHSASARSNDAESISESSPDAGAEAVDVSESAGDNSEPLGDVPVELEVKEERGGRFARSIKRPVRVHLELDPADGEEQGSHEAVDSLNVSVTGAIILHHFLAFKEQQC